MTRKVLITGGLGYFGVTLANLLKKNPEALAWGGPPEEITEIELLDIVAESPNKRELDADLTVLVDDLQSEGTIDYFAERKYDTIFHFGGVPSGGCQRRPELGYQNVKATETVLEIAARTEGRTRVIFASSLLAFENIDHVNGRTRPNAEKPYGKSKRLSEEAGMRYSERVDFRGLRVSTVIANRAPSTASTAFWYTLPNNVLRGKDCVVPVSPEFMHPLVWIDDVMEGFVGLHNLPEEQLVDSRGEPYRVFNVPSQSVTAEQWVTAVQGQECEWIKGSVSWREDRSVLEILGSAGKSMTAKLAQDRGIFPSQTTKADEMVKRIYAAILDERR